MRILAVDYGAARTGIAVSDESATIVGEAWVIEDSKMDAVARTIVSEAESRNVDAIVVGYPKNMNGTIGESAIKSEKLANLIRAQASIDIVLWDERMTSISAHRILSDVGKHGKKRKKAVDAVAASLILENYLGYLSGRK